MINTDINLRTINNKKSWHSLLKLGKDHHKKLEDDFGFHHDVQKPR